MSSRARFLTALFRDIFLILEFVSFEHFKCNHSVVCFGWKQKNVKGP